MPVLYHYHKSMAYSLADEPGSLDATDLNRCRGSTNRARMSIIGYNAIIWNNDLIRNQVEIDSLGLGTYEENSGHRAESSDTPHLTDASDLMPSTDPFLSHFGSVDPELEGLTSHRIADAVAEALQTCEGFGHLVPMDDLSLLGASLNSPGRMFEVCLEEYK